MTPRRHFDCVRPGVPGLLGTFLFFFLASVAALSAAGDAWPAISSQTRPWVYWWWMGSAVDKTNLTRELQRYQAAHLGGVHIIPVYGAKGYEDRFIPYLSPKWMEMLDFTVREAGRLGMGVDMTTGTGWCFGGPEVNATDANALLLVKPVQGAVNRRVKLEELGAIQALVACSEDGTCIDVTRKVAIDGALNWNPPAGQWQLYAVSQRPSGQKVKRAAPGGEGNMLNLFYPEGMQHYLGWFDHAFNSYLGRKPRAMYHDSYEYRSDWAPDFFSSFERRRGYRLQQELSALLANAPGMPHLPATVGPDHAARVKSDYRETISDIMAEETLPAWTRWAHARGMITRNEAHGSPGNWLDLYAAADIPETEMFHLDRDRLVSKFASSAAHVTGKRLASAETGTWLTEHFTETLADMKYLVDDMFLSGINHIFYHGTCYSPDDAGWPGWVFYASYEMNPRNSVWHDVGALNDYVARCQSVLQSGNSDNDVLLYWPIHDLWHNPKGLVQPLTVHGRDWFDTQPIGQIATRLWNRGYAFDYVSDRELASAKVRRGQIRMPGGSYRILLVPHTTHMPLATFREMLALARSGATIIFEGDLPNDVPGWGNLEERRQALRGLAADLMFHTSNRAETAAPTGVAGPLREAALGSGRVLAGDIEAGLEAAQIPREEMFDRAGLMCVRRVIGNDRYYFIANRSAEMAVKGWIPIAAPVRSATIMDPLTGHTGSASLRSRAAGGHEAYLELPPGAALILRCQPRSRAKGPEWVWGKVNGQPLQLNGRWEVRFTEGGPDLPPPHETSELTSWTTWGDTNDESFAGSAVYRLTFEAPATSSQYWKLDLGRVCQSARVRLNGRALGTLLVPPFEVTCPRLKSRDNVLEIEVTNTSANRVRDLDRRGVSWKRFYDINFVNLDYKPFNAADWPLADAGLLGPVTLTPLTPVEFQP